MIQSIKSSGIAIAGLLTSFATVFANVLISGLTGFNLFSFSLLFVIPVGAIGCGMAAAAGYYYAARYLHSMPSRFLLLQMVVITAASQIAIYWLEYKSLFVDGQRISEFMPFQEYLGVFLASQQIVAGRGMQIHGPELGSAGYWLAGLQFVGFLAGGVLVYLNLSAIPVCNKCRKYLDLLATKLDVFGDADSFASHYELEFQLPVDSPEFASHVGRYHAAEEDIGAIKLETEILQCPECINQTVKEKVYVRNEEEYKEIYNLSRSTNIPDGVDVLNAYLG
jgi:hypothetical protein